MEIREMREYLESMPAQRLLAVGIPEITFYNLGNKYQALCPFHGDTHLGSFTYNPYTNVWKCFSCGEGGKGVIKLVMQVKGWDYVKTVKYLYEHKDDPAVPFETTPPQSLLASGAKTTKALSSHFRPVVKPAVSNKEKFINHDPLSPKDIDRIYTAFAASSPLTEKEVDKLCAKRGLFRESATDFFRFPSNWDMEFWNRFRLMLQMYDRTDGAERLYYSLIGVPGFYWDVEEDRPGFVSLNGSLGILSHGLDGLINGIELRTKAQDGEVSRYIGFSSLSICLRNPERCVMGTKSDVVVDVVPKKLNSSKGIAITEGKFKALHLSYKGYTALNVRGIGNWPKTLPVLKELSGGSPVTIAFDADMKSKPSVAKTSAALARTLMEEGYKTQFLTWPPRCGKGFDDLDNAGLCHKAITVPAQKFLETTLDPFLERAEKRKQASA